MRCSTGPRLLLLALTMLSPADLRAQAQEAPTALPEHGTGTPEEETSAPLAPGEVARVDGVSVSHAEYLRYLGTVYARLPVGELAVQQELTARLVRGAAEAAHVTVTEADVEDLAQRLDARARAETGGAAGLFESLDAEESEIRRSLELLALQEKVIAAESGVEHPSDQQLRDWMDARLADMAVLPAPLGDPIAARWPGGELTRVDLGRRIYRLLEPNERGGVLTELLGVMLIRSAAAEAGIELTPEAVADEVAQRDAMVRSRDGTAGVSYADIVQQMQKVSLEELVASPGFGGEVLLRLLVEERWSEAQLQFLFEAEREAFEDRLGPDITFEQALPTVQREVRQRTYRQLFEEGRIVRRF